MGALTRESMMKKSLGIELTELTRKLDPVFEKLEQKIYEIEELEERKKYLKALGNIIASVETDICFPIRIEHSLPQDDLE